MAYEGVDALHGRSIANLRTIKKSYQQVVLAKLPPAGKPAMAQIHGMGSVIGVDRFGISAPGDVVVEELGITPKIS